MANDYLFYSLYLLFNSIRILKYAWFLATINLLFIFYFTQPSLWEEAIRLQVSPLSITIDNVLSFTWSSYVAESFIKYRRVGGQVRRWRLCNFSFDYESPKFLFMSQIFELSLPHLKLFVDERGRSFSKNSSRNGTRAFIHCRQSLPLAVSFRAVFLKEMTKLFLCFQSLPARCIGRIMAKAQYL